MERGRRQVAFGAIHVSDRLRAFRAYRERMNERLLEVGDLDLKRFFALDERVYHAGALPSHTKELLGLVSSLVLRCDDCVAYHLIRCREEGLSDEQIMEALTIGLVVGGSITIPHLRRAVDLLDDLTGEQDVPVEGDGPTG